MVMSRCAFGKRTAEVLVRAVLTVLLAVTVGVQFADAASVPAAERELGTLLQHQS